MAEVRAFRAVRYDERAAGPLSELICPPYDVISASQRAELAERSPDNLGRICSGAAFVGVRERGLVPVVAVGDVHALGPQCIAEARDALRVEHAPQPMPVVAQARLADRRRRRVPDHPAHPPGDHPVGRARLRARRAEQL